MRPRIAICGEQGAGKTTVADALRAHFGLTQLSLAEPIKAIGEQLAHDFPEYGIDPKDKVSFRPPLQSIGKGGRKWRSDLWIRVLDIYSGVSTASHDQGFVVDDLRRKNEEEFFHANDFYVIRIQCDEETRKNHLAKRDGRYDVKSFEDESETEISEIAHDIIIENGRDRTIDGLISEAIAIVEHHFILTPADRADMEGA